MDPRVDALPANRAQNPTGKAANLCPFGCLHGRKDPTGKDNEDELNEHGYCRHLIGWTDPFDPSTVQLREKCFDGRERTGLHSDKVKGSDIVVPMRTAASRVYRAQAGEKPVVRYRDPAEAARANDTDALIQLVQQQSERLEALQQELNALKQTTEV